MKASSVKENRVISHCASNLGRIVDVLKCLSAILVSKYPKVSCDIKYTHKYANTKYLKDPFLIYVIQCDTYIQRSSLFDDQQSASLSACGGWSESNDQQSAPPPGPDDHSNVEMTSYTRDIAIPGYSYTGIRWSQQCWDGQRRSPTAAEDAGIQQLKGEEGRWTEDTPHPSFLNFPEL